MKPHELRVVEEQKELQVKLDSLGKMIDNGQPEFIDNVNWSLLVRQYGAMSDYNEILKQRISFYG